MQSRPIVEWDSDDPEALFLLLIEDLDILEAFGDVQFKHWIVTNIPGTNCQNRKTARNLYKDCNCGNPKYLDL